MIYRIHIRIWSKNSKRGNFPFNILFDDDMMEMGLKPPTTRKINPRARFYFTELGWKKFGRELLRRASTRGFGTRLERKKNPKKSETVYEDAYQVAILP